MRRRRAAAALAVTVAAGLAGCGGDDEGTGTQRDRSPAVTLQERTSTGSPTSPERTTTTTSGEGRREREDTNARTLTSKPSGRRVRLRTETHGAKVTLVLEVARRGRLKEAARALVPASFRKGADMNRLQVRRAGPGDHADTGTAVVSWGLPEGGRYSAAFSWNAAEGTLRPGKTTITPG